MLGLSVLASFIACGDGKRDIRRFYFPAEELRKGLVYVYQSEEGDTTEQRYWYYRAFRRDSGLFLTGTQYDRSFQVVQFLREKIVDNGSLARTSMLYETDTASGHANPIQALIESPNLFPFRVTDSLGVFLFRLKYHPLSDNAATIFLIRNRRYLGDGPAFVFKGKNYPTVRFGLHEAIGHSKEGTAEVEGRGEEWYAEGLGLVYYRKAFGDGHIRYAYRLKETIPMAELEQRAGAHFQKDGQE